MDSLNKQSLKIANQLDDSQLINSFRTGELESFNQLVLRYQRIVTAIAFRFLNNKDDALEVCQETFLRAYDKLDSLQDTRYFKAWLIRIATNQALNKRNSRKVRQAKSLDLICSKDDSNTNYQLEDKKFHPVEKLVHEDLQKQIAEILTELPEKQSQCLVLFCFEKLPQAKIAEMLDIKLQLVKWNIFQARKRLKERLSDFL